MSDFEPIFLKLVKLSFDIFTACQILEWTFYQPLSFWIEKTTKHQILEKHWFSENRFRWNFESRKTIFGDNLHSKNETVGISLISWKSIFSERLFWRRNKNNSRNKNSSASYFLFQFLDNTSVLSQIEKLKKLKMSPTSGQFFGTRQNLNRNFYSVSEYDTTILSVFEWKFSRFRLWNKIVFTKKFYWRKNIFSFKTSEKNSDFETNFQNASECESRLLKRVSF